MLEERGRVVAVEADAVWVETQRGGSCGSCAAQDDCGSSVLEKALRRQPHQVRVRSEGWHLVVGDQVVLGVAEGVVLRGALFLYLVPLAGLLAGALLGQWFGATEAVAIGGAGLGLASGLWAVWWRGRREAGRSDRQPVVLRVERSR